MGLSFITLYSIQKARTGAAATIQEILKNITLNQLIFILITILVAGIISFFLTIFLAKRFSKLISKINYSLISIVILIFVFCLVIYFSGFLGILVFIISTNLGLLTIYLNIRRTHLLGCLVIPAIIFSL